MKDSLTKKVKILNENSKKKFSLNIFLFLIPNIHWWHVFSQNKPFFRETYLFGKTYSLLRGHLGTKSLKSKIFIFEIDKFYQKTNYGFRGGP